MKATEKPIHLRTRAEHEAWLKRNYITGLAAAFADKKWREAVKAHEARQKADQKLSVFPI